MEEPLNQILVFKTNIKTEADRLFVKELLDGHSCIRKWTVDLNDVDCVLRIVLRPFDPSTGSGQAGLSAGLDQDDRLSLTIPETIRLITRYGYECSELI